MGYLTEPKDPAEIVTVGFDFANLTAGAPSNPSVSVAVRWGSEAQPSLQVSGTPFVTGTVVYQRFVGGAPLHDYDLKCLATMPSGDRFSADCTLMVRTRPT